MSAEPGEVPLEELEGRGLFAVPGLRGAGVASGVKPEGALDLGLVACDAPMHVAGVFTQNRTPAAPVTLCRRLLEEGPLFRGVVINSGNANALTGPAGDRHAERMAEVAEEALGGRAQVLSTGVIGVPLPIERVEAGIREAAGQLCGGAEADAAVGDAMLTTDTTRKLAAVRATASSGEGALVGGLAKGSGMIHPDMATMLAVTATDVPVEAELLGTLLREAVDRSFHRISVDGDTSTNDTVLVLAPVPEPGQELPPGSPRVEALRTALTRVCQRLARRIVEDGEGRSRIMEIHVTGAPAEATAALVAREIARSPLVKTALAGGDPNWGRILAAAGNAGVDLEVGRLTLRLGDVLVFQEGRSVEYAEADAARVFEAEEVPVTLDLGEGASEARVLTTDLTHRYVDINADYRS